MGSSHSVADSEEEEEEEEEETEKEKNKKAFVASSTLIETRGGQRDEEEDQEHKVAENLVAACLEEEAATDEEQGPNMASGSGGAPTRLLLSGKQCVDWLEAYQEVSHREEARRLGSVLLRRGFLEPFNSNNRHSSTQQEKKKQKKRRTPKKKESEEKEEEKEEEEEELMEMRDSATTYYTPSSSLLLRLASSSAASDPSSTLHTTTNSATTSSFALSPTVTSALSSSLCSSTDGENDESNDDDKEEAESKTEETTEGSKDEGTTEEEHIEESEEEEHEDEEYFVTEGRKRLQRQVSSPAVLRRAKGQLLLTKILPEGENEKAREREKEETQESGTEAETKENETAKESKSDSEAANDTPSTAKRQTRKRSATITVPAIELTSSYASAPPTTALHRPTPTLSLPTFLQLPISSHSPDSHSTRSKHRRRRRRTPSPSSSISSSLKGIRALSPRRRGRSESGSTSGSSGGLPSPSAATHGALVSLPYHHLHTKAHKDAYLSFLTTPKFTEAEVKVLQTHFQTRAGKDNRLTLPLLYTVWHWFPPILVECIWNTMVKSDPKSVSFEESLRTISAIARGTKEEMQIVSFCFWDHAAKGFIEKDKVKEIVAAIKAAAAAIPDEIRLGPSLCRSFHSSFTLKKKKKQQNQQNDLPPSSSSPIELATGHNKISHSFVNRLFTLPIPHSSSSSASSLTEGVKEKELKEKRSKSDDDESISFTYLRKDRVHERKRNSSKSLKDENEKVGTANKAEASTIANAKDKLLQRLKEVTEEQKRKHLRRKQQEQREVAVEALTFAQYCQKTEKYPQLLNIFGIVDVIVSVVLRPLKLLQDHVYELEGYLLKKSAKKMNVHLRSWKKRWCVLKGGCLRIYKHKKDKQERKVYFLDDCGITVENAETFVFRLKTPTAEVLFRAQQLCEMQSWMTVLMKYTYEKLGNRFESFAPPRSKIDARWYICGKAAMAAIADSILSARSEVFITGKFLSPFIFLKRPPLRRPASSPTKARSKNETNEVSDEEALKSYRLDRLLRTVAERGVKIYVLLWDRSGLDNQTTTTILNELHPNIYAVCHAPRSSEGHNQRIVVIDQKLAYLGNIDLAFGRWDDPSHYTLIDECHLSMHWPGKDYMNPRLAKPKSAQLPFEDVIDRTKYPRMPWHGIMVRIDGLAANDVTSNFIQRWNHHRIFASKLSSSSSSSSSYPSCKYPKEEPPPLFSRRNVFEETFRFGASPPAEKLTNKVKWKNFAKEMEHRATNFLHEMEESTPAFLHLSRTERSEAANQKKNYNSASRRKSRTRNDYYTNEGERPRKTCVCQIVRSISPKTGATRVETSLYSAYLSAIDDAQHFIYMENATLLSVGQQHQILERLIDRIMRAILSRETFRFFLILPLHYYGTKATKLTNKRQHKTMQESAKLLRDGLLAALSQQRMVNFSDEEDDEEEYDEQDKAEEAEAYDDDGKHKENEEDTKKITKTRKNNKREERQYLSFNITDYISVCCLRNWAREDPSEPTAGWRKPVTEEIQVHSNLMIVDDRTAIIGSANISDKGLLGKNSEIGIVVEDQEFIRTRMNGAPYLASRFAHLLRTQLWSYYLGFSSFNAEEFLSELHQQKTQRTEEEEKKDKEKEKEGKGEQERNELEEKMTFYEKIMDPICSETFNGVWWETALHNTSIYKEVFPFIDEDDYFFPSATIQRNDKRTRNNREAEEEVEAEEGEHSASSLSIKKEEEAKQKELVEEEEEELVEEDDDDDSDEKAEEDTDEEDGDIEEEDEDTEDEEEALDEEVADGDDDEADPSLRKEKRRERRNQRRKERLWSGIRGFLSAYPIADAFSLVDDVL
ncbi:Phospholipase D1 [Balamuthia mandrillaris]